ncbi:MAG: molybdopterin-dependent oxidoreductase, partial [Methanosarcinales archaeon]
GRLDSGRKAFVERFLLDSFGSINLIENIANESHSVAYKLCLDGKHDHMKPDIMESQFLLYFGTSPLEANYPMNRMSRQISDFFKSKGGVLCVVDPRFSNTASKADIWVPIRPGTDGALAMAMIKWILDNRRYDKTFLENTSLNAAIKDGETTWTDATYLVRLDNGMLLRAKDIGLGESDQYVVWTAEGAAIAEEAEHGILESDTVNINDIPCKPVFTLLKEEVNRLNIDEYAEICGIREETIVELARGFTDNGKKAAADFFGGVAKHTNGVYSCRAIITLNFLIGNINWKGGLSIGGGHWSELGGTYVSRYNIKEMHPNKVQSWGVPISRGNRGGIKYEDSEEYKSKGYPAKRPWFPFSTNNCQSAFAGIAERYPYPIKALIINNYNPVYSSPGMRKVISDSLKDTKKVPLLVSIDIKMNETNVYADYILPDVTYLERWGFPHLSPSVITKSSPVMKPVVDKVYPNTKSLEEILILLAKEMNLSGFGNNGFSEFIALNTPEDFYLKLVANIAYGDKIGEVLPGITENDKIEYVLSRGGRFENEEESYVGEYIRHKYTNICRIYSEELANSNHSITGERFNPLPTYQPIKNMKGKNILDKKYPYHLITYKLVFHSNSITKDNSLLLEIFPENFVFMNSKEATRLGIKNGDKVSIISATNKEGIIGKVKLIDGIRPDVIGISHHFGHWLSEEIIGITPNPIMRLDTSLGITSVSLEDPIGGSASYFDTKVKVIKM